MSRVLAVDIGGTTIKAAVTDTARVRVQQVPEVVLAAHRDRAGLVGAALLAHERLP